MAELLVKAKNINPKKSVGDVVVVKPDGWKWGKDEKLPRFIVVKIPDMTVEEAQEYLTPLWTEEIFEDGRPQLLKHRAKNIKASIMSDYVLTNKSSVQIMRAQLVDLAQEK